MLIIFQNRFNLVHEILIEYIKEKSFDFRFKIKNIYYKYIKKNPNWFEEYLDKLGIYNENNKIWL